AEEPTSTGGGHRFRHGETAGARREPAGRQDVRRVAEAARQAAARGPGRHRRTGRGRPPATPPQPRGLRNSWRAPREDYALIGDCETAALVSRAGSIDWLCWPRFDSAACFAALLGTEDHGRWLIAPADETAHTSRRYRKDTVVLETRHESSEGAATVIDFMPPPGKNSDVVRIVRRDRGRIPMPMDLLLPL